MFRFFDKPIVKISLICVFSALICISIGLQIYDADVPGQVAAQKKRDKKKNKKKKKQALIKSLGISAMGEVPAQ